MSGNTIGFGEGIKILENQNMHVIWGPELMHTLTINTLLQSLL